METEDGFIVGIYNYCDRWCETCQFTSRCRIFEDRARYEAEEDPNLAPVVHAPPLPQDVPPPLPRWAQEIIDEMNEAAREPIPPEELKRLIPVVAPSHRPIEARARAYCFRASAWLDANDASVLTDTADPRTIVAWFHALLPPKIYRALTGLADGIRDDLGGPTDYDGSAKVALLGLERSHVAWLEMVQRGMTTMAEAAPFIADLVWLGEALEEVFPNARAFVRPGFDEPEEVARLLAAEQE